MKYHPTRIILTSFIPCMNNNLSRHIVKLLLSLLALCLIGPFSVDLFSIPLTLQTLVICLVSYWYGWTGFFAVIGYLIFGLIGLPVFSHYTSNPDILQTASAGFVLSFPILSIFILLLKRKISTSFLSLFLFFLGAHILLITTAMSINFIFDYKVLTVTKITQYLLPSATVKSAIVAAVILLLPSGISKKIAR